MKIEGKFAESLTNTIIDRINEIDGSPDTPWFDNVGLTPRNFDGLPYTGANNLLLSMVGGRYSVPIYITYKRAQVEGLQVKKGEKSYPIQVVKRIPRHKETKKTILYSDYLNMDREKQTEYDISSVLKHYNVFNIEQTNIQLVNPSLYESLKNQCEDIRQRLVSESQNPLQTLVDEDGWLTPIFLDQISRAYYDLISDNIHLPKRELFKSDDQFYSTLLHEMAHSTGHSSRLNRIQPAQFGSPIYAKEELVAELTSAIIGQKYGVSVGIVDDNAKYLKGWLKHLKQEPEFLLSILDDVMKASRMISDRIEVVSQSFGVTVVAGRSERTDQYQTKEKKTLNVVEQARQKFGLDWDKPEQGKKNDNNQNKKGLGL